MVVLDDVYRQDEDSPGTNCNFLVFACIYFETTAVFLSWKMCSLCSLFCCRPRYVLLPYFLSIEY